MSRIAILNLLFTVLLFGVCYAVLSPCTNLRLLRDNPTQLQYHLVWDPPATTTSNHYRVRCLRGCEAYTSVQWDVRAPSSKVPMDVLLRSNPIGSKMNLKGRTMALSAEFDDISFVLGVTHVGEAGLESPSVDITLSMNTERKEQHSSRDEPTTSGSLTSGSPSLFALSNTTSNATSTGSLTSGSSSTSTSTTGTTGATTAVTITITFAGDPAKFDKAAFAQALARALGVPVESVRIELARRKRDESFSVVAHVTYPSDAAVPNTEQVNSALASPAMTTYLQDNNYSISSVQVDTPTPPTTQGTTGKKGKGGISGGIIAAIVVPIVVVIAVIVIVVVVVRVRRRRWEQRGIELEQIYKSF